MSAEPMERVTQYVVTVTGCDDSTTITVPLTDTEATAVKRVAEAITVASEYSCMPRMHMEVAR